MFLTPEQRSKIYKFLDSIAIIAQNAKKDETDDELSNDLDFIRGDIEALERILGEIR